MATVVQFRDLRSSVTDALRLLSRSSANQEIIRVGTEACEVEWAPDAYFHHSLLLPLALLTAAIDEGAAKGRWRAVRLVELVGAATKLDNAQRNILTALANSPVLAAGHDPAQFPRPWFAQELVSWIDRFDLSASAFAIDRARANSEYGHQAVEPSALMSEMPGVIKPLRPEQQVAAVVVLALYNKGNAQGVFKGGRLSSLNPVGLDAFSVLRATGGEEAHAHLLRLLAAYRGW